MHACVEVNNWETLDDICNGIYEQKFDLTWAPALLERLFQKIGWVIEPLYRQVSPTKNILAGRLAGLHKSKTQDLAS